MCHSDGTHTTLDGGSWTWATFTRRRCLRQLPECHAPRLSTGARGLQPHAPHREALCSDGLAAVHLPRHLHVHVGLGSVRRDTSAEKLQFAVLTRIDFVRAPKATELEENQGSRGQANQNGSSDHVFKTPSTCALVAEQKMSSKRRCATSEMVMPAACVRTHEHAAATQEGVSVSPCLRPRTWPYCRGDVTTQTACLFCGCGHRSSKANIFDSVRQFGWSVVLSKHVRTRFPGKRPRHVDRQPVMRTQRGACPIVEVHYLPLLRRILAVRAGVHEQQRRIVRRQRARQALLRVLLCHVARPRLLDAPDDHLGHVAQDIDLRLQPEQSSQLAGKLGTVPSTQLELTSYRTTPDCCLTSTFC